MSESGDTEMWLQISQDLADPTIFPLENDHNHILPAHFMAALACRPAALPRIQVHHRQAAVHPPPKKRAKIQGEEAISTVASSTCCKRACLSRIAKQLIGEVCQAYANASEKERMTQLLSFLQLNKNRDIYKYSYSFQGMSLCFKAAFTLFGCS